MAIESTFKPGDWMAPYKPAVQPQGPNYGANAMPAAVVVAAITGAAGVGTTALASRSQSSAARRASLSQRQSEDAQLAYMRQKDERDAQAAAERAAIEQKNFEAQQELQRKQFEAQEDDRLFKRKIWEEDRAAEVAERDRRAAEAANYVPAPAPAPDPYTQQRIALRNQALGSVQQLMAGPGAQRMGVPAAGNPFIAAPGGQPLTIGQLLQLQQQGKR